MRFKALFSITAVCILFIEPTISSAQVTSQFDLESILVFTARPSDTEYTVYTLQIGNVLILDQLFAPFSSEPDVNNDQVAFIHVTEDTRPDTIFATTEIFVINVDGTIPRQLTNNRRSSFFPSWSSNGKWIAYRLDGKLHITSSDGKTNVRLFPETMGDSAVGDLWMPNGDQLALSARIGPGGTVMEVGDGVLLDDPIGHFDLYLVNADGSGLTNLTNGLGNVAEVYPSPDGRVIAFSSVIQDEQTVQDGYYSYRAYLIHPDGTGLKEIYRAEIGSPGRFHLPVPVFFAQHPWSPDGKWLALPANSAQGEGLRLVSADGLTNIEVAQADVYQAPQKGMNPYLFSWSPDSAYLVGWGQLETGESGLCVVNRDGSDFRLLKRVQEPKSGVEPPIWSPDGRMLAFVGAYEDGSEEYIGIMNADGTGFRDLSAELPEKPVDIHYLQWAAALPTPTPTFIATSLPTAAATPAAPRPTATPLPGNGVCTTTSVVIVVFVLALWLARRNR